MSRREGASVSRALFADRFNAWLQHHRISAADSLARLFQNPLSSIFTWLVLAIALALPAGLSVALENAVTLRDGWVSPSRISLFLVADASIETAQALRDTVAQRGDVVNVELVSREEALTEFLELSGFADILESLEDNPLPHLVLVSPTEDTPEAAQALRDELLAGDHVAQAVVDMAWLQRLNELLQVARRLVMVLAIALSLGVLLILGNTIRLAIENRREEIVVVKLVGGSNGFVRRPFLYTGLWYGVGGGLVAAALVTVGLWWLGEPVARLAELYESTFRLSGLGVMGALNLILLGGLLGLGGAWVAVTGHLAHIEPQ